MITFALFYEGIQVGEELHKFNGSTNSFEILHRRNPEAPWRRIMPPAPGSPAAYITHNAKVMTDFTTNKT